MESHTESLLSNWSSLFGEELDQDEKPLDDLHLNNAINLDYLKLYLKQELGYNARIPSYIGRELDSIFRNIFVERTKVNLGFQQLSPDFYEMGLKEECFKFPVAKAILETIQNASVEYKLNIPIVSLDSNLLDKILIPELWWYNFNNVLNLVNARSELRRDSTMIGLVPCVKNHGGYCTVTLKTASKQYTMYTYSHVSYIHEQDDLSEIYLGTFDSVLLLLDTLGQRICLQISNLIASYAKTPGYVPLEKLEKIINIGDGAIRRLGNPAYEIIAMFESICVGTLLSENDDHVNPSRMFIDNCLAEAEGLFESENDIDDCMSCMRLWEIELKGLKEYQLSNIFCVYRIWGHPTVDIKAGMAKVYKLGTVQKFIPERVRSKAVLQFRKMFLMSFYSKHSIYPPVVYLAENYTSQCMKRNCIIDTKDSDYSILDFDDIELKKIWDVPETYDIFHVLNDKAVSPNISELHSNVMEGKGTQCGALRRGLWRWMTGDSIRCRDFLNDIDENGLNPDAKIIGMYEKEREIKITARMFSLMSEEMRYYFVLTEELIANHILPYFPEITMKDSLNTLLRKLWSTSKRTSQNKYDTNINIDFSKWNLNMRDDLVGPVFKEIDKLFGYENLIARTHTIFTESFIYSASGKYIPKVCKTGFIQDPPMSYTGHIGGFEGLRQKGWTIVTVLLLAAAAEEMGINIRLMGQGDNQVVRLQMPSQKWISYKIEDQGQRVEASKICTQYVDHISMIFHDAQLPIKVRETWRSCRLFMYGKMMILDNQTLPQWYKKVLRSYALSNEGVLTFGGVIGTIATNMSSASSTSSAPDVMYILYTIFAEWSISCLLNYHPFTRKSYILNPPRSVSMPGARGRIIKSVTPIRWEDLTACLILIPTSVGGNITIPMTSFICRGFPDPGSEGYAWIKFLMSGGPRFHQVLNNWYSFVVNPTIELDQLIQSPLSINHWKPPTPGLQSRDLVRDWLVSGEFKNNRFIKNVSIVMKPFDRKKICGELATDPMSPLVSNELYNIMPHVAIDGVLRRIENTRTIRRMAMSVNTKMNVIQKLMEAEDNFLAYIWFRSNTKGDILSGCATEQARKARDLGWGRKIIQVTAPHPLELLLGKRCTSMSIECTGQDHIYVRKGPEGRYAPYLGSKTKTKVHTQQDEAARKEPLISTGAKLARYLSWLNLGPNIRNFIERNVRIVCDLDVFDNFFAEDLAGETFTGSVEHRFNPTTTSDGSFINYAPQVGSSVFMSSDYLPTYGRGKTNYTLPFQPLYCFIQFMAANTSAETCIHFHLDCDSCIVPTDDNVPDIGPSNKAIERALDPEYFQIIRDTLGHIDRKPKITTLEHPTLRGTRKELKEVHYSTLLHSIYTLLGHVVASKIRTFQEGTGTDVGLEDLQSYPRIYSYKLCVDTLMTYTARALIFQHLLKREGTIGIEALNRTKRKMTTHLSRLSIKAFKDLGALCLGRNYEGTSNAGNYLIRSFPESIDSYLEGIRDLLIRTLDETARLEYSSRRLILPAPQTTKRIHLYIISEMCSTRGCTAHMDVDIIENAIPIDDYPDCKEGCVKKSLRNIMLTPASLDRMFKELTVTKKAYNNVTGSVNIPKIVTLPQLSPKEIGKIPEHLLEKQRSLLKPNLPICLPTSSLYKWESVADLTTREHIIVLGDGTGGTSLVFASRFPSRTIYPCALIENGGCIPQDMDSIKPSMSRGLSNVSHMIHMSIPDDILDLQWVDKFNKEILIIGPQNVTVVSDVEYQKGNRVLQDRVLEAIPDGTEIILKFYAHEFKHGFLKNIDDPKVVFSPVFNNVYNEVIVAGIRSSSTRVMKESSIRETWTNVVPKMINMKVDENRIHTEMKAKYMNIWRYNINFSLLHVSKSGINMNKDVLTLKTYEILSMINFTLKKRYHFGNNGSEGTRRISPKTQDGLCRGIIMTLLIWTNAEIDDASRLRIQPDVFNKSPVVLLLGKRDILSNNDLRAVKILREYRSELGYSPESITTLEEVIVECSKYGERHRTYTWTISQLDTMVSSTSEKYTQSTI
ncbi:TPA_asm: polyprotein [Primula virus 1]|uniref:Replicase n=1 Tax=Primula virus 1 TaxID=2977982 RepID=A0A9N6YJ38_9RHAB|nr:TPA_asm: polyprotein [Primula virus 1]